MKNVGKPLSSEATSRANADAGPDGLQRLDVESYPSLRDGIAASTPWSSPYEHSEGAEPSWMVVAFGG